MLSIVRAVVSLCILLVTLTALSAAMNPDTPAVPNAQMVPVWEENIYRPQPVHVRHNPSSPDAPPSLSTDPASSPPRMPPTAGLGANIEPQQEQAVPLISQDPIPAFVDETGLQWGPYDLHSEKFQPHYYPYRMKELAHLYSQDGSTPAELENVGRAAGRGAVIPRDPFVYRPEPQVLDSIFDTIKDALRNRLIELKRPSAQHRFFYQGMFLWPPVQRTANGLQIHTALLESKYKSGISARLRAQKTTQGGFYKLTVTAGGQQRSILVTMSKPGSFTTVAGGGESTLSMFYEPRFFERVRRRRTTNKKGLAFLGVMLLPKQARDALLASGQMFRFAPR